MPSLLFRQLLFNPWSVSLRFCAPVTCLFLLLFNVAVQGEIGLSIETSTKVAFPSESGKSYQVFGSTNLDRSQWFALGPAQNGSGGTITFFYTTKDDQKVFFKVEEKTGTTPVGTPAFLTALSRLNLYGQNLSGLSLTNLDLRYFSFLSADLRGADLRGADFRSANLNYANLSGANVTGANFTDANSFATDFSGCIGFKEAKFGGQSIQSVILNNLDLSNFDFTSLPFFVARSLTNCNLTGAKFQDLSFLSSDGGLGGSTVKQITVHRTIALLQGANLDFSGSDFSGAQFQNYGGFQGANFTGVNFKNAFFDQGNPIPFDNANFTDADLSGSQGFVESPGIIFKNTKMPDGTIRNGP